MTFENNGPDTCKTRKLSANKSAPSTALKNIYKKYFPNRASQIVSGNAFTILLDDKTVRRKRLAFVRSIVAAIVRHYAAANIVPSALTSGKRKKTTETYARRFWRNRVCVDRPTVSRIGLVSNFNNVGVSITAVAVRYRRIIYI